MQEAKKEVTKVVFLKKKKKNGKHTKPQGCKTFFMLNSSEHKILSANKYENANTNWHVHIYWQRNFHAQLLVI